MPNSVPGISAGCMLVFILAIGYYITPELVGGKDGQMIGNWIAYHLKTTLNWGLCAALGSVLLFVMLVFYWVYNKIIGGFTHCLIITSSLFFSFKSNSYLLKKSFKTR